MTAAEVEGGVGGESLTLQYFIYSSTIFKHHEDFRINITNTQVQ